MKILVILLVFWGVACTTTYTRTEGGAVAYFNTIGGDHTGVTVTPTGTHIESMKHSESFKNGTKAIEKVLIAKSLASVAKNKDNQDGATARRRSADSTARHSTDANVAINANNNATQAAIRANDNATRIASEQIQSDTQLGIKGLDVQQAAQQAVGGEQ